MLCHADRTLLAGFKADTDFNKLLLNMVKEYQMSFKDFFSMDFEQVKMFVEDLEKIHKRRKEEHKRQMERYNDQKSKAKKYKRPKKYR